MSKLRPEYQKIFDGLVTDTGWSPHGEVALAVTTAVERCQALADKPPKELTDEELVVIYATQPQGTKFPYARAAIAAHIAKQKSPTTLKTRAVRHGNSLPFTVSGDYKLGPHERWASDAVEVTLYPGE